MALPAGYTQVPSGAWMKDSDGSGPYAWSGVAMYLLAAGLLGTGTVADYNQHGWSGFWFKTDTSGPYAKDASGNFVLAAAGGGPVDFTNITADTLKLRMGGSFELYNTTPISSTNYERLKADWSSNVARIWTQNDGTGSPRSLQIGVNFTDGSLTPIVHSVWRPSTVPSIQHTLLGGATLGIQHELASSFSNFNASSGTQTAVAISPTFAGTGAQVGVALLVNPSGTFGSGGGFIQAWQLNSSTVGVMTTGGTFSTANVYASGLLGLSSSIAATSADVQLNRDAADSLAQRRTANAQTFRLYNTYTDTSNYRRWAISWTGTNSFARNEGAGTGAAAGLFIPVTGSSPTLAALPTAAAAGIGARAMISDGLAPVFMAAAVGGGAVVTPVYSDGANWLVG